MMSDRNDRHRNLYEDPLSVLFWWYDLLIFAMMFPSNSVLVFLRKNLGYRLMRPWVFLFVFAFLFLWGFIGGLAGAAFGGGGLGSWAMLLFAVAMGALSFIHRRKGWQLVLRPVDPIHTMSRGDSWLTQVLPVPEWQIQRIIEPVIVAVVGVIFWFVLGWTSLGIWLFVSAVCLAGIEALVLEKAINALLDVVDDRIESNFFREMDDTLQGKRKAKPNEKSGGMLVAASPELLRLRAQRLAARPPPDDLAPPSVAAS